jgi:hypothetical protein
VAIDIRWGAATQLLAHLAGFEPEALPDELRYVPRGEAGSQEYYSVNIGLLLDDAAPNSLLRRLRCGVVTVATHWPRVPSFSLPNGRVVELIDAEDLLREVEQIAARRGWHVQGELGPDDVDRLWQLDTSEQLRPYFAWEFCVGLRYTLRWWGTILRV